ncbi:MAG: hypothetical protein ACRESQ_06880 [Gammaproteobacteria bacterium]
MKQAVNPSKVERKEKELYRAFLRLDPDRRTRVALRILHDEKVLADIYDHFLIQESLKEGGRNVSWKAHLRPGKSNGR